MAKKILKLENPIKVNGKTVSELPYDFMEMTNDLYLEATMKSSRFGNTINAGVTRELNEALAFCFGKAAIIAVNSEVSWEDLDQLKGFDLLNVSNIGRFFITRKREDSNQETSESSSELTPNDSTQAPEKSGE